MGLETKHTVYFATSRRPEQSLLNRYLLELFCKNHELLLIADHKFYTSNPHERGLTYKQRVDDILSGCSGLIAVLPRREYPQTTAPFMFLELLLATKYELPILLLCEEGVRIEFSKTGTECRMTTGYHPDNEEFTLSQLLSEDFKPETLTSVHSIKLEKVTYINNIFFLPDNSLERSANENRLNDYIEQFKTALTLPRQQKFAFYISPYKRERETSLVKRAIFEQTSLPCLTTSDTWVSSQFPQRTIYEYIVNAKFVIADASKLTDSCIFETGVAVGSGREVILVRSGSRKKPTFGLNILEDHQYIGLENLRDIAKKACEPYRVWVYNLELLELINKRGLKESSLGIPDWYFYNTGERRSIQRKVSHAFILSISLGLIGLLISSTLTSGIIAALFTGITISTVSLVVISLLPRR